MIEVVRCFLAIQLAKFGDLPSNNMGIPLWRFQPSLGLARPWSAFTGGSFKTFILTSAARFNIRFKPCHGDHGDWTEPNICGQMSGTCWFRMFCGLRVYRGLFCCHDFDPQSFESGVSLCCIRTHDMPKVQHFIWSSKATQGSLVINYAHIIGLVYSLR